MPASSPIQEDQLDVAVVEAKLREGDAHLPAPSRRVELCRALPHRLERGVAIALVVGRVVVVPAHPMRREAEGVRRALVMVRVEGDPEVLRRPDVVAPAEGGADLARPGEDHAHRDVERGVVVREAHREPVGGRGAFGGVLLGEVGRGRRGGPRRIVQAAVDHRRRGSAHGHDALARPDAVAKRAGRRW
jgi:hypothetical protein